MQVLPSQEAHVETAASAVSPGRSPASPALLSPIHAPLCPHLFVRGAARLGRHLGCPRPAHPLGKRRSGPVSSEASRQVNSLTGKWLGHQLTFSYNAATRTWFALAGVSFETTPGKYTLELSAVRAADKSPLTARDATFTRTFIVARAQYPQIKVPLTVEKKFTEPSPEQQQQIAEDEKVKEDYLNRVTPDREWDGKFTAPADASISDVYGSQRIFNGKAQRPHSASTSAFPPEPQSRP